MTTRHETTEEELRSYTIGELKPHEGRTFLADYDPDWTRLFEREAHRIRQVLGDTVVLVEHVGSTSVPGLPAKPVIYILLAVPDSSAEATYAPTLGAAGYVLRIREPDWYEHRVFKGPDTSINLHVFSAGSGAPEIERMLLFRNWLRSNSADRERYAQAKRDLAAREWKYVQHYADAKTEVVEDILSRARAGASATRRT